LQVGTWALDQEQHGRANFYGKPLEDDTSLTDVPGTQEILTQVQKLKVDVLRTLDRITDRELYSPRFAEQNYWWQEHERTSIDAYHRVVWHANAHIRQIWCLRGAMGAVSREHFPRQFWH
jgi:hypothetical protein